MKRTDPKKNPPTHIAKFIWARLRKDLLSFTNRDGEEVNADYINDWNGEKEEPGRLITEISYVDRLINRGRGPEPVGWVAYLYGLTYAFPVDLLEPATINGVE